MQPGAHGRPFVSEDRVDGAVPPGAIGPRAITAHDALERGADAQDGGAGTLVEGIRLNLDPAEAVVEGGTEHEQFGFGVDGGAPDARVVGGPAEVDGFLVDVDVAEGGRSHDVTVVRAAEQSDHVGQGLPLKVIVRPLDEAVNIALQGGRAATVAGREHFRVRDSARQVGQHCTAERLKLHKTTGQGQGMGSHGVHPTSVTGQSEELYTHRANRAHCGPG